MASKEEALMERMRKGFEKTGEMDDFGLGFLFGVGLFIYCIFKS